MAKTKFFRVATSGATTDGRNIEEQWLKDMAETYDPNTYQARVNLEHIMAAHPESAFGSYGDVLALKTEPVTLNVGGKPEQRLGLYAQIDALPPLEELNKKRQKLFSSIQVLPDFGKSGRAYLGGLAVTDNPASLGTEQLAFCAQNPAASPLAFRKIKPDAVITVAEEIALEFADSPADTDGDGIVDKIVAALKTALSFGSQASATLAAPIAPVAPPPAAAGSAAPAFSLATLLADPAIAALAPTVIDFATRAAAAFSTSEKRGIETQEQVKALSDKLDKTPDTNFRTRYAATGDNGADARTDC